MAEPAWITRRHRPEIIWTPDQVEAIRIKATAKFRDDYLSAPEQPDPPRPVKAPRRPWELSLLTGQPSKAIWGSKDRARLLRDGLVREVYEGDRWVGDVLA